MPTLATAIAAALLLVPLFANSAFAVDSGRSARVPVTTTSSTVSTTSTTLLDSCGDGTVDALEDCDDGGANSDASGAYCSTNCVATACGAPVGKTVDTIRTTDALFALRASVKLATCSPYVCDVDGGGTVNTTDALTILRKSVGFSVSLVCPSPEIGGGDITCMGLTFTTVGEVFAALAGDYDVTLDGGSGGIYDSYATGTTLTMRILENFLGNAFVSTARDGSTSYGAAYYTPEPAGFSWEDLEHEVNVFFGVELGTTKILQCDKTNGQLTFVVTAAAGGPNFARLVTNP